MARKASRRRSSRRSGTSRGIFTRLYSPISHALAFGSNTTDTATNTAKSLGRLGFGTVNRVGKSLSGHLNGAVKNLVSRKNRRGSRKTRRNRRN